MFVALKVMIGLFCLLGIVALIFIYGPMFYEFFKKNHMSDYNENSINEQLGVLKNSVNTEQKAIAFISLMQLSYVLVHILVNHGNNYDDRKQVESFSDSMTPQVIDKIKEMEGIYG